MLKTATLLPTQVRIHRLIFVFFGPIDRPGLPQVKSWPVICPVLGAHRVSRHGSLIDFGAPRTILSLVHPSRILLADSGRSFLVRNCFGFLGRRLG